MNKKGVADLTDPKYWGITLGMYILILIFTWKMSIGSETNVTRLKIVFSVAALPIIAGITYLMGQNG